MVQWLHALRGHELAVVAPGPADRALGEELRARYGVELFTYRAGGVAAAMGAAGAFFAGRPLQEGLYGLRSARMALGRGLEAGPRDLAIVQMVRCAWAMDVLQEHSPGVPILFDAIDAMGLHFGRAALERRAPMGPLLRLEAARCRKLEMRMAAAAAVTTAVASRDLKALGAPEDRGRVVPVAAPPRLATDVASARTVLLSGNLGYRPTVDGALWFGSKVWPRLIERHPGVRWVLAGARPPAAVRRLERLPDVEIHADVPDLAPYLAAARVSIAPMDSGSGVPMKVLESWACGVPVVARPWAAAGLMGEGGVRVARGAEEWLEALDLLLGDENEALRLAARGREMWERFYRPERVDAGILDAVQAAVS